MKTAGIKEFKARLSQYLREIQRGETILVTDRGRVVAEVRPPGADAAGTAVSSRDRRLLEAVERGVIRLPTAPEGSVLWADFKPLGLPAGTAQSLLDDARVERDW